MNNAHLEAILKATTFRRSFVLEDGSKIFTNGHIAFKWTEDFPSEDYPNLGDLWVRGLLVIPHPSPVGPLSSNGSKFYRQLRDNQISEAYFRCFDGPGITWTEVGKATMLYVHRGAELVGIVMPVRYGSVEVIESATDADVFEEFACEGNGYYSVGQKALRKEIAQLVEDLEAKEERIIKLQSECSQLEKEIDRKRGYLANLRTPAEVTK